MKINEVTKVTGMNTNDYAVLTTADGSLVQIKKADLANALADVMRTASSVGSSSKNGLMPGGWFGRLKAAQSSLLLESPGSQTNLSILLAISPYSGGTSNSMSLYFVSVTKDGSRSPVVTVKVLAGGNTMKVRYKYNSVTDGYRLYIERTQYTPTVNAILMSVGNEKLSMVAIDDSELEGSIYATEL